MNSFSFCIHFLNSAKFASNFYFPCRDHFRPSIALVALWFTACEFPLIFDNQEFVLPSFLAGLTRSTITLLSAGNSVRGRGLYIELYGEYWR